MVGRPREHGDETAEALLAAAERIVDLDGVETLSVRRLADEVGTTTRAIYTVFGSKNALLVALGCRAFDWLAATLDDMPLTQDPVVDLVEAGTAGFRRFAIEHPALFRIGVQNDRVAPELAAGFRAAADNALGRLESRLERLAALGLLGDRSVRQRACEFHALCEGLAAIELRGGLPANQPEAVWRDALRALVLGFSAEARTASKNSLP